MFMNKNLAMTRAFWVLLAPAYLQSPLSHFSLLFWIIKQQTKVNTLNKNTIT